ncbi:hypothetical protein, partial [Amycolatopsis speibonae]
MQWYEGESREGEWRQYDDLLSLLQANSHRLPVNIWLEPIGKKRQYTEPLVRWVEVWMRAYQQAKFDETGAVLTSEELAKRSGGVVTSETVGEWKLAPSGEGEGSGQLPADPRPGIPKDLVSWRPGVGVAATLKAYAGGREVPRTVLLDWFVSLQEEAVADTGLGVPGSVVAALSGGLINAPQARKDASRYARLALGLAPDVTSLVPRWVKDFRPGEGEWSQVGDIVELLTANRDLLPVNIWLEPGARRHSKPLVRWVEVWMRAYHAARVRENKEALTPEELAKRAGNIVHRTTVANWKLGVPQSVADHSLDNAPSGEGEGSGQLSADPRPGIPKDVDLVSWRPGVGGVATLKAYAGEREVTDKELREWGIGIQREAVDATGMRASGLLVAALSGELINAEQANKHPIPALSPDLDVSELVPPWVKGFRPGEVQWYEGEWREGEWHEGEWRQYDDLLLLLQANSHRLPVNIWLEPIGKRHQYTKPLVRWVEVWMRAYQQAKFDETGAVLTSEELAKRAGNIVHRTTVINWKLGVTQSVADHSLDNTPSGSAGEVPSGISPVGVSTSPPWKRRRLESGTPGVPSSGLGMPGSGFGAGAPSFSAAGMPVPVVPGAGDGGWVWPVGSELQQVEMQGVSREFREEMSQWLGREEQIQPAPVGVLIGGVGSVFRDAAALLLKEAGVHGVVLLDEGAPDLGVIVRGVLDSGWVVGEAIRLFACEVGDGVLAGLAVALS